MEAELLRDGAAVTRNAGRFALDAADRLDAVSPMNSIFGDFEAAHHFHSKLVAGQRSHVAVMRRHHATLHDVGAKARCAAATFDQCEADNVGNLGAMANA
ncbi:DUF2563 family protein [Mycobacterium sp. MYCO198283]|uniref:DUF2563 family protein n=1 Tax=Mycobacterium sp. MYCO198283 TaxID=2883505 RepID=UPI001E4B603D|nr:DUF2563 family protein [Mycobacterium sp. MYCO198283]MCG5432890.1 DUF2563 family protein [Mycobacterium sp. MYCO198283]